MRALQVAVVAMGVLIVAGVVVLVTTLVQRAGGISGASGAIASAVLEEPAGTRIAGVSLAPDRASVQLKGGGADRVVILDTRTGRVVARIGLAR